MKTKIIQNIKSIIIILTFVIGVTYVSAQGVWTDPACGPTGCNALTPINVGPAQIKTGSLTLGGLGIFGDFKFLPLSGTPPTTGQVLMADDTNLALGKVKWGTPAAGGGGGGVTKITAGTNITISPTTGVGDVTINSSASGITISDVRAAVEYITNSTNGVGTVNSSASCTSPKKVVGGGCSSTGPILMTKSAPSIGNQGWNCTAITQGTSVTFTATAICL